MDIDISLLDGVIKKTIQTVESSQEQIFEIAESARRERSAIQNEIAEIREEVYAVVDLVDSLDLKYRKSRAMLAMVSRNFHSYTEEHIHQVYKETNDLQVELSLSREREATLRQRRDELERRLQNLEATIAKAEQLMTQIGVVLGYLTGDFSRVGEALETAKQHQQMGLQIIQAQEEERKRVAREIHDGPAQSMANVALRMDIAEKMLKNEQILQALAELQELKEMVRLSLADVRRIIFDLRPMALDDLGLIPTLQKYVQTFEERTGTTAELVVFGREQDIDDAFKTPLFRLVQECLNNVAKHAKAKVVHVKLELQHDNVSLVVKDNGVGFDVIERRNKSFGLMGMKERVQLLNGTMEVASAPLKGTKVMFQIPLKAKMQQS
ncbi:sensor histidine kinase [Brevibacillus massiliensis]|jgi:two-component system sensor histidine kinase DegS|uniref:sensor histidine kinase n=1 Tax=Brevibacillus massiliensis TaxID=1118054 RepID=UPI0002E84997|nr:sensor histidine kinase [Brevibacillus massiliensis]